MLTYEKLVQKVADLDMNKHKLSLLVTVVRLPTGALETLVNTSFLDEKIEYILGAYDENLRLKSCDKIQLLDCIML